MSCYVASFIPCSFHFLSIVNLIGQFVSLYKVCAYLLLSVSSNFITFKVGKPLTVFGLTQILFDSLLHSITDMYTLKNAKTDLFGLALQPYNRWELEKEPSIAVRQNSSHTAGWDRRWLRSAVWQKNNRDCFVLQPHIDTGHCLYIHDKSCANCCSTKPKFLHCTP